MSINFEHPINEEALNLIQETFGTPIAQDERTVLLDRVGVIKQQQMKAIANAAKQPATIEVHSKGDIKTLSDGTRYQVTSRGWIKLDKVEIIV